MDVPRAIRATVETGKVVFGERETLKKLREGKIRLVVVAANCPPRFKEALLRSSASLKIPIYEHEASTMDLGSLCGKPFPISMLGVSEAGDSNIFELGRGEA
jgi:large subunit ribosomal protein L30e